MKLKYDFRYNFGAFLYLLAVKLNTDTPTKLNENIGIINYVEKDYSTLFVHVNILFKKRYKMLGPRNCQKIKTLMRSRPTMIAT